MTTSRSGGAEILLTGATGSLGKVVLHELLRRQEELGVEHVHVVIRGKRGAAPEERFRRELVASPCFSRLPGDWANRVTPVSGDLSREGAGLASDAWCDLARRVTRVIHCASSVEFELSIRQAATANVTTALNVLELGRSCSKLAGMVSVSTAYVTPHRGDQQIMEERLAPLGRAPEELYAAIVEGKFDHPDDEAQLLAETGHPNTYTFTKCLAEHLLVQGRGSVPLALVRPSIISVSWRQPFAGWIDSPSGFTVFVLLIATGRMRAVMAGRRARLDLIPCDAVATRVIDAAFDLSAEDSDTGLTIRHAVMGFERSPTCAWGCKQMSRFFELNPVADAAAAGVQYVGPDGLRYRLYHFLYHRLRRASRPMATHLAEINRLFAYFSHRSFRFRSTVPFREPDFEADAYFDTVCRGIWCHLLSGDDTEVDLARRGRPPSRGDLLWALGQPRGNAFIRAAAYVVAKALRRAAERVTVDVRSFREASVAAPPGATLVLVPSHRSYMDFVLCSYLCFARPDLRIGIPHVAAAIEFARIPILGRLFGKLHAFYLTRGLGREDKRLTRQVDALASAGATLEFFIEGRRSRSRRFLPPRRGLLRSLQATGSTCALLPVAVSYDHVPEETAFLGELRGGAPPPMLLRDLLAWSTRLARGKVELGRIHVACGKPVELNLSSDVYAVSHELIARLQSQTVTTTHHLRSFLERADLAGVDLGWLCDALTRRGGRVLEVPQREQRVPDETERCMRNHFLHFFYPEAALAFAGNPAAEHHIRRNGYAPAHQLDPKAQLRDPRVAAVVRRLFEPVCRDYAAVARELSSRLAGKHPRIPLPAELARAHPDAHLPDLEAAFEDLCEREILLQGTASDVFSWGPRADHLVEYASQCARLNGEGDSA